MNATKAGLCPQKGCGKYSPQAGSGRGECRYFEGSDVLEKITDAIQSIKFGLVTIVVQDGQVIQIEKTEKMRLPPKNGKICKADQSTGG